MTAAAVLRALAEKATPGPWEAWEDSTGRCIIDAESEVVGDAVVARSARLIALAPELAKWAADAADALDSKHFVKGAYQCRYCWRSDGHSDGCLVPALLARLASLVGEETA